MSLDTQCAHAYWYGPGFYEWYGGDEEPLDE